MSDDDMIRRGDAIRQATRWARGFIETDTVGQAIAAIPAVTPATSPGVTAGAVGERCYLIRKGGHYYRPDRSGYTAHTWDAGLYTLEEAERETHPNGPDGPRDGMSVVHVSYCSRPPVATPPTALDDPKVRKLVEAAIALNEIVEGISGVMDHGVWRDERGVRLKDTPEWVAFYNARAALRDMEGR